MQQEINKDNRLRKKKAKTWTEAAKLVLDMYPKTPMGHKDIFNIIRSKGLKDVSGPASLACLNAMLHVHSKGSDAMFYRVAGSTSVFGLTSDIPEGAVRMEIEEDDTGMDTGNEDSDIESGHTTTQEQIIKERKGVLYVKLPSGFKSSPPPQGINSNHYQGSIQNQQDGNSFGSSTTEVMLSVSESSRESDTADNITQNSTEETLVNGDSKDVENTQEMVSMERCPIRSISSSLQTSNIITTSPAKVSQSHSQRAIKHALRQQQKRRRRNTAIAASGTSTPGIPRIIMKPLPPPPNYNFNSDDKYRDCGNLEKRLEPVHKKPQTMRELLASIPGLSLKPRKRSNKKLSAAAQIAQTKKGCIDLETPDSILVNTNLRALLNKHTFASLPPLYQYRLVQLLPPIDHVIGPEYSVRLSASALSNEFFARSCQEWRERLAEGEFTPENQQKLKAEAEREHSKLDPWKIKYFEPVWGQKPTSDFPEQGKSSPFLIGASPLKSSLTTPSKHVPTIKIKQLVKKNRLVPAILKHRSSVGVSSSNNYQVSSNLNAVSHSKLACSVSDGTSNESSSHKRPLKITIDSSSLTCNKKIKPSSGFTTNPVITTVTASVTATETTENILQSNTTQSTSEQEQESNIIVQEAANSSSKPKIIPRPAARSPSLVPPITIRSVPVVRQQVGRRGLNRNSDGVNLERSYQICQAVLESSRNRSNFISSGHMQFKARPGIVSTVTKANISSPEQCPLTATSVMPQPLGRVVTVGNRTITGTSGSTLLQTVTSQQVTLQSSSSPLLLTTCSPTNDNYALGLGSTTVQIKTIEPDIIGMVTETSITEEVETTSIEGSEVVLPPSGQEAVIISNGSMVSLPSNLTLASTPISDQPSIVVVTDSENQPTSPNPDQVILLASDVAFTVDSNSETTNPTTVVITAEDGTILAESDCCSDDKNPVLVVTHGLDACSSLDAESTAVEQISVDCTNKKDDDDDDDDDDDTVTSELAVVSDCFSSVNGLNNHEPSHGSDELYIAEDEVQDEIAEIHSSEKENSNESTTILMESAKEDEEISNDLITTEDNCCKNSSSGCDSLESIQDADQETKEENFCQEKIEEQQCDTPISLSSVETRWRPSSAPPTLVSKDNSSDETYLLPNIKKFNSYQDIFSKQMNSVVQSNNCLSRPLSQSFLVVGNTSCARFPGAGGNNSFGSISFSAGQLVKNGRNVVTLAGEMSHLEMRVATGLSNGLGMVFGQMPLHLGDCGVSASTGLVVNSQLLMSGFPLQHSGIAVNAPGLSQSSYPVTPGGILMTQDRTGFNNHLPLNDGHTPAVTMVAPLPIVSTGSIFPSVNGTTTVVTAPVQSSNMHGTTGRSPHALVNGVNSETASEGNSGGTIPPSDISGNNNCACNLKAMVMCRKCGAFCHDDCIGPSRLCVTCLIR